MTRGTKYGNRRVRALTGEVLDSRREARRYQELLLLQRAGEITDLRRQVKYVLIPTQRGKDGRVIERECSYYADFVYCDRSGAEVVEDAKGFRTEVYRIKRKLMLQVYGVRIVEV